MLFRCRHCGGRFSESKDVRNGTAWDGCKVCKAPSTCAPVHARPPTPLEEVHEPESWNPNHRVLLLHAPWFPNPCWAEIEGHPEVRDQGRHRLPWPGVLLTRYRVTGEVGDP